MGPFLSNECSETQFEAAALRSVRFSIYLYIDKCNLFSLLNCKLQQLDRPWQRGVAQWRDNYISPHTCCMETGDAFTFVLVFNVVRTRPWTPWLGRLDHCPSLMRFTCIYTRTSLWSSTLQLHSDHKKQTLIPGAKGSKVLTDELSK